MSIAQLVDLPDDPDAWLRSTGRVFREFPDQDSHCTSVGFEQDDRRWFVKWSAHEGGRASLRRAIVVGRSVQHPALIPLVHAVDAGHGVLLVYPFVDGEPVRPPRGAGGPDPFRALPWRERARRVDTVLDLHVRLAELGFVAVDLYDGSLMVEHATGGLRVYDLDEYRPAPFVLEADRLPGSTRFMAPEEFVRGSRIDPITNVFVLGRLALVLLGDHAGSLETWPGPVAARELLMRATSPDRNVRPVTVAAFVTEYRAAMQG